MRKILFVAVMAISFLVLFPLSWRIGEAFFFTRPFDKALFDPVLLVCSNHVEILRWHELVENQARPASEACTFHVVPERQAWVESAARHLQSPVPGKSSWTVRVKQLEGGSQQIDLKLVGDGIAGMIYEVRNDRVTPFKSQLTGPAGAFIALAINVLSWAAVWLVVWRVRGWLTPSVRLD